MQLRQTVTMRTDLPQRKIIRLRGYDYSQAGAYFCTICVHRVHRHKELLGRIRDQLMQKNRFGALVEECWREMGEHRAEVELDEFVVMPNHVHLLLWIEREVQTEIFESGFGRQTPSSLPAILGGFKSAVTRAIGIERDEKTLMWQPRYHDRVVRTDDELRNVRRYIENNPANWHDDRCNPTHPDFERVWNGLNPDPDCFATQL